MQAMRALKRRLSDIVYRQMVNDSDTEATGPGGHPGATLQSSAASPIPTAGSSEQSLPEPAEHQPRTLASDRLTKRGAGSARTVPGPWCRHESVGAPVPFPISWRTVAKP
jgi:hypothetical protein